MPGFQVIHRICGKAWGQLRCGTGEGLSLAARLRIEQKTSSRAATGRRGEKPQPSPGARRDCSANLRSKLLALFEARRERWSTSAAPALALGESRCAWSTPSGRHCRRETRELAPRSPRAVLAPCGRLSGRRQPVSPSHQRQPQGTARLELRHALLAPPAAPEALFPPKAGVGKGGSRKRA